MMRRWVQYLGLGFGMTVLTVLLGLVLRQYLGDRYFRAAMICVEQTLASDAALDESPCSSLFDRAGRWTPSRSELHYQWAKHYERMMHQAAAQDGTWKWRDGRGLFHEGARSRALEARALQHYRRAIELNPAAHHYHLDMALLIRAKLYAGERPAAAMLELETPLPAPVSAAAAWHQFSLATRLAPRRTYNHRVFADWLVEHLLAVPMAEVERQRAFTQALYHYRRALDLQPRLLAEVLDSLMRLTSVYDELVAVLPDGLRGLPDLVLFLHDQDQQAWADNRDRFLAHWDRLTGAGGVAGTAAPAAELEVFYEAQAALLRRQGRPQEALQTLKEFLLLAPEAIAMRRWAATLALQQGDYPEAAYHASRALAQNPSNRSYLHTLIAALERMPRKLDIDVDGEWEGTDRARHAEVGGASERMPGNRHDEAAEELEMMLAVYPEEARIYEALGNRWLSAGRVEEAERIYHLMINRTRENARGYFLLGRLYEQTGRPAVAREHLKRATLLDRRYRSYFNRTLPINQLIEAYFSATRDYRRLRELLPESPENLSRLVLYLHRNQAWLPHRAAFMADLEAARREFAQGAGTPEEERPQRPWLTAYYLTLAEIHWRDREVNAALAAVQELIALDPANSAAQARLARLLLDAGRPPDEALPHLQQAMRLEPEEPRHVRDYALALAAAGRFPEAEELAGELVQQRPKDPAYHALLARVYEKAGKRQLAIEQLSKAVSLSRQPGHYERELVRLLGNAKPD